VVWVLKESICEYWRNEEPEDPIIESAMDHEPKRPIVDHLKDKAPGNRNKSKRKATEKQILHGIREYFKEVEGGRVQRDVHVMRVQIEEKLDQKVSRKPFERLLERPKFDEYRREAGRPIES
jgi:hypothetical protein